MTCRWVLSRRAAASIKSNFPHCHAVRGFQTPRTNCATEISPDDRFSELRSNSSAFHVSGVMRKSRRHGKELARSAMACRGELWLRPAGGGSVASRSCLSLEGSRPVNSSESLSLTTRNCIRPERSREASSANRLSEASPFASTVAFPPFSMRARMSAACSSLMAKLRGATHCGNPLWYSHQTDMNSETMMMSWTGGLIRWAL